MQRTADFHHRVANPGFPQPAGLLAQAAAYDAAVALFDAHAPPRHLPMARFPGSRQRSSTWLLPRLHALHAVQRARLTAQVLHQLTPGRQGIGRGVGGALVLPTARMRVTPEQDTQGGIDQQDMFEPRPLLLAAITRLLFSRGVGARDGALGALMTTRGATGGGRSDLCCG